jgi:hypothetical protein
VNRFCEAIGILLVGFIGTGCAAMIYSVGVDPVDSVFPSGASRQDVEAKLGTPVTSRALPEGGRVDTYKYIIRQRNPITSGAWVLYVAMLGTADIFFVPKAIEDVWNNRRTATFTYDPNNRLLDHGPPPPYGPPDDAVGSLSLNEIRERCRSDVSGDPRDLPGGVIGGRLRVPRDLYDECLVRRLAIWGIE